ncbi:kinase-like domain-containing protein [Amylocarpus encephaloides]|uniref:non-specific serine/threonine protein kinase n=1 Tax=Amylocarpus encephaloides TaxID=45428 RepID=A0A9P7Y925_9HELO|nr:kinase-like domain-containing protein [Amylocarpus encephaloides]
MTDPKKLEIAIGSCGELQSLPPGWRFDIDSDNGRVFFIRDRDNVSTVHNPNAGPLPPNWRLQWRKTKDGGGVVGYYNTSTTRFTGKNPRHFAEELAQNSTHAPFELQTACSSARRDMNEDTSTWVSQPIAHHDFSQNFKIVHTIDDGEGGIGAMNGGVHVVKLPKVNSLYIRKIFKRDRPSLEMALREIQLVRKAQHSAITVYHAAFHAEGIGASLYIEFCDRGSLKDLIKAYSKHIGDNPLPSVPEGFVWHAFGGLTDALAYLKTGTSYIGKNTAPVPSWNPILHRDVKPDNILLRSRSTLASKRYFYCVLSDFGLACELDNPLSDNAQKFGGLCGTCSFWAPELCFAPYATRQLSEAGRFAGDRRHSSRSDLWALGACMYNLCMAPHASGELVHVHWPPPTDISDLAVAPFDLWFSSYISRQWRGTHLAIPERYSPQLQHAIAHATALEVEKRPNPVTMTEWLKVWAKESGFHQPGSADPLPEWATKKHEYFTTAELKGV